MLTPVAFLQAEAGSWVCAEGPLEAVGYPRPGSPAFFAPDFSLDPRHPWWLDAGSARVTTLDAAEWRERFRRETRGTPQVNWSAPDEPRFREGFESLTRLLHAGHLRKGVPITKMSASLSADAAVALFKRLMARVPDLPPRVLAYGLFIPAGASGGPEFVIGATPEMLFELHGRDSLSTMAVAGTRQAVEAGGEALAASPKDRDEHHSVVEDLLAQLSDWGQPRASGTEVRTFGQLAHLVADITLDARQALDFESVARRLHPTPALGVYPRGEAGQAWLASIDSSRERKRFGAPFGLRWPSGGGRCVVAIRNLQYAFGRLELWAGCGVVAMSRYDEEWREIQHKMQAVRALWDV